jgi:hypothetical protein
MATGHDLAREILDPIFRPYLDAEVKHERVRLARTEPTGVRWSGMSGERLKPRTVEELYADAKAAKERDDAFWSAPRGRFLSVVRELCALGQPEGETLMNIWSRSLADDSEPVNTEAAIRAIRILSDINTAEARKGIQALCDIAVPMMRAA